MPADRQGARTCAAHGSLLRLLALVLSSLAPVACVGAYTDQDEKALRTDSAGVEIVSFRGEDTSLLEWEFEEVRSRGGSESDDASFYELEEGYVDVDSRGRIYVLNRSAHRVTVFDSAGAILWSGGREGGGPGELQQPYGLSADSTGAVWVFDGGKQALVGFAGDGTPLDQVDYPLRIVNLRFPPFGIAGDGLYALDREGFAGQDVRTVRFLYVERQDTTELFAENLHLSSTARYERCGMTLTLPRPYAPGIWWDELSGRAAFVAWSDYRVDIFDRSSVVRSIRRAIDPAEVEEHEVMARFRDLDRSSLVGRCVGNPRTAVEKLGYHPTKQIITGVAFGPDGHLWVRRRRGDEARGRIDVFDPRARYIGTLPAGSPMPAGVLPDGRIVAISTDAYDADRLGWYEIRR